MSYTTTALLFVEDEPSAADEEAITAVVADGQAFARIDKVDGARWSHAGGHEVFCGAVYAAEFNYVSESLIESFVSKLPLKGDVILYARAENAERPLVRIRERIAVP